MGTRICLTEIIRGMAGNWLGVSAFAADAATARQAFARGVFASGTSARWTVSATGSCGRPRDCDDRGRQSTSTKSGNAASRILQTEHVEDRQGTPRVVVFAVVGTGCVDGLAEETFASRHPGGLFAEQVSVSASRPLRAGLGAWHRSCSCSCNFPLLSPPHLQETREGTVHAAAYAATRIERPGSAAARESHR